MSITTDNPWEWLAYIGPVLSIGFAYGLLERRERGEQLLTTLYYRLMNIIWFVLCAVVFIGSLIAALNPANNWFTPLAWIMLALATAAWCGFSFYRSRGYHDTRRQPARDKRNDYRQAAADFQMVQERKRKEAARSRTMAHQERQQRWTDEH